MSPGPHRRTPVDAGGRSEGDQAMPFVNVKVIEGVFTDEQKREMVTRLTDTMVAIEGENLRPVTWVLIEELKSGDWGMGGQAMTAADVRALAAAEPAPVS
jgi:4-oxalocrotonate tautomerase